VIPYDIFTCAGKLTDIDVQLNLAHRAIKNKLTSKRKKVKMKADMRRRSDAEFLLIMSLWSQLLLNDSNKPRHLSTLDFSIAC